jgi:hypothetical protein
MKLFVRTMILFAFAMLSCGIGSPFTVAGKVACLYASLRTQALLESSANERIVAHIRVVARKS